ncbi:MAG TPA: UvrD-helicase domain-containing protein [Candidatus Pullichristensenella excrementigallinarum]|uniref:UvrD-helicase domain-containing protein n=1 Tax=Candidatus Pullichristensenella excrementigallinarum TaxID=2840907 RepID=A0A9D1LB69_9FIRM|nr:UvrD-helicase domain-containing protein [Candidatus Pullichristensenella excrementigallinarum]
MYIADLHIHSRYSRATSRDLDARNLDLWARRKGVGLVGTGDFTHPAWREELREALEPCGEGVYRLREEQRLPCEVETDAPRFVVSGEISTIYKQGDRTRKVHSVILLPSLEDADELSRRLEAVGNIRSDGRPILGLSCRDLLEITLEACPQAIFIPAHIWTPHFSLFGAFSGFHTLEECFGDLSGHISALETGLSSDPAMNHRVSALDKYTLVSNSDAHSPSKLAREANLLEGERDFSSLARALQTGEGFLGTIEFFPEEGKYHLDGHRNCGICLEPIETIRLGGRCPVCGKKLTVGVMHRVEELADRPEGACPEGAKPFESLAPLKEVVAASSGASVTGKKVEAAYCALLKALGSELHILRETSPEEIERVAGPGVAEGIRRLRAGKVRREAGYDGVYGTISLFEPGELEVFKGQLMMAGLPPVAKKSKKAPLTVPVPEAREEARIKAEGLNPEQRQAVEAEDRFLAVIAGPGTGKTRTLVERIAHLLEQGANPGEITAVTFTNQAAREMQERLETRLGGKKAIRGLRIGTFHAIGLSLLPPKALLGREEARELAAELAKREGCAAGELPERISRAKNGLDGGVSQETLRDYQAALEALGARDLDDVLLETLALDLRGNAGFRHVLVDEFQDINPVQRLLVRKFAQAGETLFVIGDPDQSIYGFRGADADCFCALERDFPELRILALQENYRSTPEILEAAEKVISCNPGPERRLRANGPSGREVRMLLAPDAFSEAVYIAKEISRMTSGLDMLDARTPEEGGGRAFSEIAVLARTRRQLDLLESCLRHDDIPCVISGRGNFLSDERCVAVLAFFRSLLCPEDAVSLKTALRLGFKCPPEEIARAEEIHLRSAWEEVGPMGTLGLWARTVQAFLPRVKKEKPHKLFADWAARFGESDALKKLADASVFDKRLGEFLENLSLGEEADIRRASGKQYASGAVRLMTLHAAKGLEFPVVFLAGMSRGQLPLEREGTETDLLEERRLLFVGMTRAREELILTAGEQWSSFEKELPREIARTRISTRSKGECGKQLSMF